MINYILRRLVISVFLLLGVGIVSWVVIQLPPGDFATTYETFLLNQGGMTQEQVMEAANRLRAQLGLDQPQTVQYLNWMKGIITQGKFGYSFAYRRDVGELIGERLLYTLILAIGGALHLDFRRHIHRHLCGSAQIQLFGQCGLGDGFCVGLNTALLDRAGDRLHDGVRFRPTPHHLLFLA